MNIAQVYKIGNNCVVKFRYDQTRFPVKNDLDSNPHRRMQTDVTVS